MQINFDKIPKEMQKPPQWVNWIYAERADSDKPTKLPYNPVTGKLADVTDPKTWGTFEQAKANVLSNPEGWHGIGFVFTENDDWGFVDLDDTLGDVDAARNQAQIIDLMDSYTETSPSGRGMHIIVRCKDKRKGVRKNFVEMYSKQRYATFTGHVIRDVPPADRDTEWNLMYEKVSPKADRASIDINEPQTQDDKGVYEIAAGARNGDKFEALWRGDWQEYYQSQSEADLTIINIIAYYTQNRDQIARMFRESALGKRQKAQRDDYVQGMVTKSFDNVLEPIDIDALIASVTDHRAEMERTYDKYCGKLSKPGEREIWPIHQIHEHIDKMWQPYDISRPPGLVGDIADFIYETSYMPIYEAALAGALGMVSGMTGCTYNINGTGLNLYIMLVMPTGFGKEEVSRGISRLYDDCFMRCTAIDQFSGPADFASGQALIRSLDKQKGFLSIMDEVGIKLQQMTGNNVKENMLVFRRHLLGLYTKSGFGNRLELTAYANSKDNTVSIKNPGVSIIGMSTPQEFYKAVTEEIVSDGLLPRFNIIEFGGYKPEGNLHATEVPTPAYLVDRVGTLAEQSLMNLQKDCVINVQFDEHSLAFFKWIEQSVRVIENHSGQDLLNQLFSRVGMKTLRVAANLAVGINHLAPVVTDELIRYAFNMVYTDTMRVYDRFKQGNYGDETHDSNQHRLIMKTCLEWNTFSYEQVRNYFDHEEMHKAKIVPRSYLQRRIGNNKAFAHNHQKKNDVMNRFIDMMVDNGDLIPISKKDTSDRFSFSGKCYAVGRTDNLKEIFTY